jgi:hypothetical protein
MRDDALSRGDFGEGVLVWYANFAKVFIGDAGRAGRKMTRLVTLVSLWRVPSPCDRRQWILEWYWSGSS